MIISHRHRFILIRQKKTAGTSIEQALIPHLGAQDYHSYIDLPRSRRYAHDGQQAIIERIGQKTWDSYYKIVTTRNPWDRAVSQWFYFYRRHDKRRPHFADYLQTEVYRNLIEFDGYITDGHSAADFTIRYEHLGEDFAALCSILGLPAVQLPHHLGEYRDDDRHYSAFYTPTTAVKVGADFLPEIALHGYRFRLAA